MARPAWHTAGPRLEDGDRLDGFKVFLGNLKQGTGRNCIEVVLREAGLAEPKTFYFLDSGTAVFVVFPTADDAANCIRELKGKHVPLVNPVGKEMSAHRGEIQAFKRSGL